MFIPANGISLSYEAHGAGPELILMHGAGYNLHMWYHQVPALSRFHRVISLDFRGCGRSGADDRPPSMPLMADDLCALMDGLGIESACLLGHSMGGSVAVQFAVVHPTRVRALILANSAGRFPPLSPQFAGQRRSLLEMAGRGDVRGAVEALTRRSFSAAFAAANRQEVERAVRARLRSRPDNTLRILTSPIQRTGLDLEKVACPVLMLAGDDDPVLGVEYVEQAHRSIAGSKLTILPGGHLLPIEAYRQFNSSVLDFLGDLVVA